MFKIVQNHTFRHEVRVMIPSDGGFSQETFHATFNYLGTDRTNTFDLKTPEGTTDFLKQIIAKLDGLTDDTGQQIEYSDKVRDAVIVMPNARQAIINAYFDAVTKVREGN